MNYKVVVLKAWTKDTLALKIAATLDGVATENVVSVDPAVDFQFFVPWRRNHAFITLKT